MRAASHLVSYGSSRLEAFKMTFATAGRVTFRRGAQGGSVTGPRDREKKGICPRGSVRTLLACPWGSIMSGHLLALKTMIPLSTLKPSVGSPSMFHCRTNTGSPSVPVEQKYPLPQKADARRSFKAVSKRTFERKYGANSGGGSLKLSTVLALPGCAGQPHRGLDGFLEARRCCVSSCA